MSENSNFLVIIKLGLLNNEKRIRKQEKECLNIVILFFILENCSFNASQQKNESACSLMRGKELPVSQWLVAINDMIRACS